MRVWHRLALARGFSVASSRNMPRKLANAVAESRALMKVMLAEQVARRPLLAGSNDLHEYLRLQLGFLDHERLLAIYVDHEARLLKVSRMEEGSAGGTQINTQRVIRDGLSIGAAGFLLVHNHPSGNPSPSSADKEFTQRLFQAGRTIEMPLLDHLIIAGKKVWSMSRGALIGKEEPQSGGESPIIPINDSTDHARSR